MSRRAFTQGLDGLCGIYAIVNSCRTIANLSFGWTKDFFDFLCEEMIAIDPSAITSGITFQKELLYARHAQDYFEDNELTVTTPFKGRRSFKTIDEFFKALGKRINDQNCVAILGMGDPWRHWTVAEYVTDNSIRLIDSSNIGKSGGHDWIRKSSLTLDGEHGKQDIHPRQTIFLSFEPSN